MSLLTIEIMNENYGGIGSHDSEIVQTAIDLAEFDISHALNTFLIPTTVTAEEYVWPWNDGRIQLLFNKVTAITTVTAKHSIDNDCIWQEDTECGVILNSDTGLILVIACDLTLSDCQCPTGITPDRAVITYVAGYTAAETLETTSTGKALRMAISLRARDWIQALEENDFWGGQHLIRGFSSMDYSEQREYMVQKANPLGPGPLNEASWRLLKTLRNYRAVMIRSSGRI